MLKVGIRGEKSVAVTKENCAEKMGSGSLAVFATPAMVALMEGCAMESVSAYLDEGCTTVGTALQIEHVSATPIGMQVRCKSELTAIDGRSLTFYVEAYDEAGLIGKGEHKRFIVISEKFQNKTDAKLQKA